MNTVDRIFSEKLGGHTSAPPAGAWEKVEASLSQRPAASPWRWAAVLVPLVIAGGWILTSMEQTRPEVVATIPQVSPAPGPVASVEQARTSSQPVAVRRKPAQQVNAITPTLVRFSETIVAKPENTSMEEITIEPVELIAEAPEPSPAPAVEKPIVIVITLESVAEAPDVDKKPLTRVAEFALAVKHSDPIGSLRGAKDELLALDLRKKSTKKN